MSRPLIVGAGSPLVDLLLEENDSFLELMGSEKGGMTLVENHVIEKAVKSTRSSVDIVPGGSTCNTLVGIGKLDTRTEATIVDREKFFEHLRGVSSEGFALDLEECEPGLCCVAAPIYDASGVAVAALSISGPAFRLTEEGLQQRYAPAVVGAAERLSRQLGFGR